MEYIFVFAPIIIVLLCCLPAIIVQVNEYERGIKFHHGKYKKMLNPGWHFIVPIFQSFKKIDIRTKAVDVPAQEAITKDNVSVKINAVLYYKVFDASKALLQVENYYYAISQLAQTTMRNGVGSVTLDELLVDREKISTEICKIIDELSDPWGIKVENVELKDISLPEEMQRVIAKVAEAEREKQALHLRTLSTINDLSSDQSNTIIFALPIEILRAFDGLGNVVAKKVNDNNNHNQE